MANMYKINSLSYTSKENPEWFVGAAFGGRLIQGGYIRVMTGVKGDELLSQIDVENKILQLDGKDCAWTPNQIIKLSEKKASVTTYKIQLEECIDTLEHKRTVYMLSDGARNTALPADLEAATLSLIALNLSNEIEELIIGGNSSTNPNHFDGMERVLTSSTEAAKLVGTTLTKTNVLDKITDVYNEISEDVLQAEDAGTLFVLCSYNTRRLVRTALAALNNQVIAASWTIDSADVKNPRIFYLGVEIVPVKGIGKNTLIAYDSKNAYLLTDMMSDLDNIRLGQFAAPNDNKVFIDGRMRLGFVMPFEDEAVIMSPSISTYQAAGINNDDLKIVPNNLIFTAGGETKTFTVLTKDTTAAIQINADDSDGYTVTKGTTTAGVTTITVVAAGNSGNLTPRCGQVIVTIVDTDRSATAMLETHSEEVTDIIP